MELNKESHRDQQSVQPLTSCERKSLCLGFRWLGLLLPFCGLVSEQRSHCPLELAWPRRIVAELLKRTTRGYSVQYIYIYRGFKALSVVGVELGCHVPQHLIKTNKAGLGERQVLQKKLKVQAISKP